MPRIWHASKAVGFPFPGRLQDQSKEVENQSFEKEATKKCWVSTRKCINKVWKLECEAFHAKKWLVISAPMPVLKRFSDGCKHDLLGFLNNWVYSLLSPSETIDPDPGKPSRLNFSPRFMPQALELTVAPWRCGESPGGNSTLSPRWPRQTL